MTSKSLRRTLVLVITVAVSTACAGSLPEGQTPSSPATPTPTATIQPTSQGMIRKLLGPFATPTQSALTIGASSDVSSEAVAAAVRMLNSARPEPVTGGELDIEITSRFADGATLAFERVLTPVDRFPSTLEDITLEELKDSWTGRQASPHFTTIFPSSEIMEEIEQLLGTAGPAVKPKAPDEVDAAVWGDPMSIGILPFDELTPRLRALDLDGASVLDNKLTSIDWPLASRAWLNGRTERGSQALALVADEGDGPTTNRDLSRLTVLAVTGVTAIARNTATAIENAGDYAFPARLVGPYLASADLTITSNEISFVEGCVADNSLGLMLFCAKPEYYATLELSGIDAIGLTGNHLNDFGYKGTLDTLDFYEAEGIPTYGGGADEEAARVPLLLTDHGNRLAFLGANQFGPSVYESNGAGTVSAWAGPDKPGAARFDREQMIADIQSVKSQVDLVFAELQHTETNAAGDYQVQPLPEQVEDFRALLEGGADVVTGVQAHAPQAIEMTGDGVILYGLGNLYFDQTWSWPTRTGLVVWHTIYEGRLLNTHLSVTVIDPDFQLRWATPEERREVLQSVFDASTW